MKFFKNKRYYHLPRIIVRGVLKEIFQTQLVQISMMIFLVTSCSGYHVKGNQNPLIGYDINSVSIPMFVNRSSLSQIQATMTNEFISLFSDYPQLKIFSGENEEADAVLIGIIDSKNHLNEVFTPGQLLFTEGEFKEAIGSREKFYFPSKLTYGLSVNLILIKKPNANEIKFLKESNLANNLLNSKIVMNKTFSLSNNFTLSTKGTESETNYVKNNGNLIKSLKETCINVAQQFKQEVLNAF